MLAIVWTQNLMISSGRVFHKRAATNIRVLLRRQPLEEARLHWIGL